MDSHTITTLSEIVQRFEKFAELVRGGKFDGIQPEMNWWLVNRNICSQGMEQENNQQFVTILEQLDIQTVNMKQHFGRYWAGKMGEGENHFMKSLWQNCFFVTIRAEDYVYGNTSPVGGDEYNMVQRTKTRSQGSWNGSWRQLLREIKRYTRY